MNPSTVLGMIGEVVPLVVAIPFTAKDVVVFLNVSGPMIGAGGTLVPPCRPEALDVGP